MRRVGELTPRGWGHLHHSTFDAVGNGAGGVVWIDVAPTWADDALSYSPEWSTNAAEYLDYVQARVQAWHHEYRVRKAAQVRLLSYQDWLIRTHRYGEFGRHCATQTAGPHPSMRRGECCAAAPAAGLAGFGRAVMSAHIGGRTSSLTKIRRTHAGTTASTRPRARGQPQRAP